MKGPAAPTLLSVILSLGLCAAAPAQRPREQKAAEPVTQPQPVFLPVATGTQRIPRDKQTIEVLRGNQRVSIDYFTELIVVTMTDDKAQPEKLVGKTISLARDSKQRDHWNVFLGGGSDGDSLVLPENVFRIQTVLPSTPRSQIRVQVDGRVRRLQPGEVLFVLG